MLIIFLIRMGTMLMKNRILINIILILSVFALISSAAALQLKNSDSVEKTIKLAESEDFYGFIIPTNSSQNFFFQINSSRLVNELLRNKIDVYWITTDINVAVQDFFGNEPSSIQEFEKGSFIINLKDNASYNLIATSIVCKYLLFNEVTVYRLQQEIFELKAYKLKEPRIAYHNGPFMSSGMYFFSLLIGGFENYTFITWDEMPEKLKCEDYNVLIWGYMNMQCAPVLAMDHLRYMKSIESIRDYVRSGGGLVGSCLTAYELSLGSSFILNKLKLNFPKLPSYLTLSMINARFQPLMGDGEIIVEIVDPESPIAYGSPKEVMTVHYQGPVLCNPRGNTKTVAVLKEFTDDFTPTTPLKINEIYNRLSINKPIWVTSTFGDGEIITFGDHPEVSYLRAIYNAVFYITSEGLFDINITIRASFSEQELNMMVPDSGTTCEFIEFNSSVQNIEDYDFYWDFGDRTSSNLPRPTHAYINNGTYEVILTVSDKNSDISIANMTMIISGEPTVPNNPPSKPIILTYTPTIVRRNQLLVFTASAEEPDGDLFYYKYKLEIPSEAYNYTFYWGTFVSGQNHIFPFRSISPGKYYVTLQAVDVHGAESEWSDPLVITVTRTPNIFRFVDLLGFNEANKSNLLFDDSENTVSILKDFGFI